MDIQTTLRPIDDFDSILQLVGNAHFVLIGEASHGTHEFYAMRAAITQRLITEKGFNAVAVEADWPDAYRINRFVRGISDDTEAIDSLADFKRFPTWMWRNADVLDFVGWLREYNDKHEKVGFYGLDLYSLYTSIEKVIAYLDQVDPALHRPVHSIGHRQPRHHRPRRQADQGTRARGFWILDFGFSIGVHGRSKSAARIIQNRQSKIQNR